MLVCKIHSRKNMFSLKYFFLGVLNKMSYRRSERRILSVLTFTPLVIPSSVFDANNLAVRSVTLVGRPELFLGRHVFQWQSMEPNELIGTFNWLDIFLLPRQVLWWSTIRLRMYESIIFLFPILSILKRQKKSDAIFLNIPKSNHKINLENLKNYLIWKTLVKIEHLHYKINAVVNLKKKCVVNFNITKYQFFFVRYFFEVFF